MVKSSLTNYINNANQPIRSVLEIIKMKNTESLLDLDQHF